MATQEMILKLSFDDEGTFTGLSDINQELAKTDTATQALEKSTKTLKAQYADLKKQQDQMDPGTEKFAKLSVQMGELKDRMNDAADAVKGNTGPAIEGARASFGMMGEQMANLDFEGLGQSLNLISGNLARLKPEDISAGLKSMGEAGMNAFKSLGKVIMANPILAIAGIIIAIAMNFDKLIKLFPGLEKSLKGINEEERKTLDIAKAKAAASQKVYENVDKQSNILKQQGKSEKEILQIKLKALETAIADRKAQLLITEKQAITQVETAKRNREILEGIIRFLTAPIQILLSAVDGIAAMLGQETKLAEGFTDLAAGLLIDPDELEAELAKTIQENKDAIGTMENDYAGLQNSIADIDKKASDDKKKLNAEAKAEQDRINKEAKDKALADALTVDQRLRQVEKDRADSRKTAIQKEEDDILAIQKTELEKYVLAYGKSSDEVKSLKIRHSSELMGIEEKYAKLRQEKLDEEKKLKQQQLQDLQKIIDAADERNIMQQYTKQQQELIANDTYYQQLISQAKAAGLDSAALTEEQARKENEIKKKYRDEDAANRMANIQKGFEMASLGLDALMSLNQAAAKGDEASQRKTFERNKLMQKAQATIAMAAGIVQQLAVPQDQLSGMNFVKAAAIAAAGVANIVKINQTQFTGGTPPSTSNLTEPTGGGNAPAIDFSGANLQTNAPGGLETYVLAGNVANALEARQKIIDQSHL